MPWEGWAAIDTKQPIALFWYQRSVEVALVLSCTLLALWAGTSFFLSGSSVQALAISNASAAVAGLAAVFAFPALYFSRNRFRTWIGALVMLLIGAAVLLSVRDTGNMTSPYLVLWGIPAVIAALAGIAAFIPITILASAYGVYLALMTDLSITEQLTFMLAVILPTLIGLGISVRRVQLESGSNETVSALTHELSQESSKSSIIINAIADGVVLINKSGIIQLINPAAERIIGWGSSDATNLDYHSVLKLISSRDEAIDPAQDPIRQCLTTGESVITDRFGIRTISGKQLLISLMASPLSGRDGGVIVVFRDITAQRAEERDQAEFISTASHEMRTPVAAIEGYLGLALNPQTATIDDKARAYLQKAHESAGNLGKLFQDLLDISKLEDGRLTSKPVPLDVQAVVRECLESFSTLAAQKSLTLAFSAGAGKEQTVAPILYATVDLNHFQEILSNLIGNAIKYTREGSVTVDVTGDTDHVFVSVKDTGIGIPAEDIPHLFQKFYRVDNSDTREIGGTGLGLYLARRLTESMGGRLNVTSTYGQGSTFTVELPRVKPEDVPVQPAATTPETGEPTKL